MPIPSKLSPSFSRRDGLRRTLQLMGALVLSSGASAQSPGAAPTLRLGYIGPAKKVTKATGWALAQGHLLRELAPLGYGQISTHVFPNGPDLNEAFLSGALDVGIYGDTPAVVARATGFDGRLIGFDTLGMNAWLLTPRDGVRSVRELDGKVVGVALGSYMHRYLLGVLKEAGIQKTTKVVHMLPRDGGVALEKGAVAAFAAPIDTGPLLASKGYPVIDEAQWHPHLRGSSVIVASGAALRRSPGLGLAWLKARKAALADIRQTPERYYAFHAEATGFPLEAIKVSHPLSQMPDIAYPPEGLQLLEGVKSFLLAEKLIRQDVDLAQWRIAGV